MPLEGLQLSHYRLVRLIGSGGMGEVYLAEDTLIHRQVAIKVVRSEATAYPDARATEEAARLFQREMKIISALDHPHILPLFDYGEETVNRATLTFMVMPFRKEGSLADWLQARGSAGMLSVADVAHLIEQAADALQHAHDLQIIHQDIKPSNFLMRARKEHPNRPDLLLADFGISKITSTTSSASQTVRGTPTYMAPEQWDGNPVPATDQYALAIMAYQLLTGRPPFLGAASQVMRQHFNAQPQAPGLFNPNLTTAIDTVILRALEKDPAARFPSVAAFAQAFQQTVQSADAATFVKPPGAPVRNDLHATLAISKVEAQSGTSRVLTLPGGRRITVSVPVGAWNGQVLRLENLGEQPGIGEPAGVLILTLSVIDTENIAISPNLNTIDKTLPGSDPRMSAETLIPSGAGGSNKTFFAPPPASVQNVAREQIPTKGQRSTRAIVLIGLVLVVLAGSIGFFYFQGSQHNATTIALTGTAQLRATHQTATTNAAGTTQAHATASAISTNSDPYPPYTGKLVLNDPLSSNSIADWLLYRDPNGACVFTSGAYLINYTKLNYYLFCTDRSSDFGNFAFQVQMTIVQGDTGGIVFRVDNSTNSKFYYFHISRDGTYSLDLYVDNTRKHATTLKSGFSAAINQHLNQTNLIAVVANGNNFGLYVNNQQIDSVPDTNSTYSYGQVGLIADAVNGPTKVVFSNAKVWTF